MSKRFMVIMDGGYWGKAPSLSEAMKNACVSSSKFESGTIIQFNELAKEEYCTDMGGYAFSWNRESLYSDTKEGRILGAMVQELMILGRFEMKLAKGQPVLKMLEDE